MKKKNVNTKLVLNKETIASLNDTMQTALIGGAMAMSDVDDICIKIPFTWGKKDKNGNCI